MAAIFGNLFPVWEMSDSDTVAVFGLGVGRSHPLTD